MSLAYGPQSLTPGIPVRFQVPKNAVKVKINNFSRYYLGVYFGITPPVGSTTTTLVQGQYHAILDPGDKPTLDIVGNYTQDRALIPNNFVEFNGNIWIHPISIDSNLGMTGGQSRNSISLYAYLSGEPAPESSSTPRIVDASSQQRVVSVPIAPIPLVSIGQTLGTAGVPGADINLRTDGFTGGLIKNAVQVCEMYLYWFKMRLNVPAAGTSAIADVTLWGDLMNGAAVVLSVALHHALMASVQTAAGAFWLLQPDDFTPTEALQNGVSGFALPVTGVRWRLVTNSCSGTPVARWSIGVGVDLQNAFGPGTHGNFTVQDTGVF